MMLGSAASWVEPNIEAGDKSFEEYLEESLEPDRFRWKRLAHPTET